MGLCKDFSMNQSPLTGSWMKIIVLGMDMFISYFAMYSIPSYAPRFIHKLEVPWKDVGNHVGVLLNILLATGSIGTLIAGIVTSKCCPKKCVVLALTLQGISCIAFGFSSSVAYAYVTVAFVGLFTIVVGIKTLTYKLCNKENQSFVLTWANAVPVTLSSTIGPALGGYLVLPAEKYPRVFSPAGIFATYPALFVQLLTGSVLVILAVATHWVVDGKDEDKQIDCESSDLLTSESHVDDMEDIDETLIVQHGICEVFVEDILKNSACIGSCLCFSMFCTIISVYDILLALWLEMPREKFGRNYDTNNVGNLYLISGCLTVISTHLVIGKMVESLKTEVCFSIWLTVISLMVSITPNLLHIESDAAFFACLILINIIVMSCACGGYTTVNTMMNDSTTTRAAPLIFTLSGVMARLFEGIGAACFASLFNWSIKHHTFPLDYRFPFYFLAIVVLLIYSFVWLIRKRY